MGLEFFDFWTVIHFMWGIIFTSVLSPSRPILSAVIANVVHLLMELVENNHDGKKNLLESDVNHIGDIIAFLLGSILGSIYGTKYFSQPGTEIARYVLLSICIIAFIQEVGRELFPETWWISPSYHENRYFGYIR